MSDYFLMKELEEKKNDCSQGKFCPSPATAVMAVAGELSSNVPIVVCGSHFGNN